MRKIVLFLLISFNLYAQTNTSNSVLIPFRDKKLWGLSDTLGTIKVKPIYKEIKDFVINHQPSGFISRYVVKSNKSYFVIDQNKKILLPEANTYDSISLNSYYMNHFWVYKKGKVGLFYKNKEIIPCAYDEISLTENQSYLVSKGNFIGLINASGKLIIPLEYQYIHQSWKTDKEEDGEESEDEKPKFTWIAEGKKGEKTFYDVIKPENDSYTGPIYEKKLASESTAGDEINYTETRKTLEAFYDHVKIDQGENLAYVTKNNLKGVIDLKTKLEIVNIIYDDIMYFDMEKNERVFLAIRNGKYGLIKAGNQALLNCEFDKIDQNRVITKDNKQGIIVFNTIYPYIKPKYLTLKSITPISISDYWQFSLFEVTTEKGKGLVGENGVEFFKD